MALSFLYLAFLRTIQILRLQRSDESDLAIEDGSLSSSAINTPLSVWSLTRFEQHTGGVLVRASDLVAQCSEFRVQEHSAPMKRKEGH